jgi:hypothetical protein
MEKREKLKTENSMANSTFSDEIPSSLPLSSIFDMQFIEGDHHHHQKGLSLGYMDMLGMQDFDSTSLFDLFPAPTMPQPPPQPQTLVIPSPASTVPESSEVVNTPATPNSSSISSSSNEAANDERIKAAGEEEDQDQEKTKKQQ